VKNLIHSDNVEMEGYYKVCSVNQLNENGGKRFIVDETEIAVFKFGKEVYALNNVCPHQHTALIYDGFIEDGYVVCPAHGWKFDLKTGKQPGGQRGLDCYPVKIVNDELFVKVYKKELKW
jgi:3-phenylpropionate/trans-cinnamate dioxygenase ferredoxin subunit